MTDFAQVAEFLEQIVVRTPGATAAGMLAQLHGCRDTATCARCGREIFTYGGGGDGGTLRPGSCEDAGPRPSMTGSTAGTSPCARSGRQRPRQSARHRAQR